MAMARAIWNGRVIAESDSFQLVEGNVYFPPESVRREYLQDSDHQTRCPWKGDASYHHIAVDGDVRENAAWYYPDPSTEASHIKDHVAFWRGVTVER
jgi:uncharacterized protein (DUF427 family)